MAEFEKAIEDADPANGLTDAVTESHVQRAWSHARATRHSALRRRTRNVAIPALAAGVVLTGAALAVPTVAGMAEPDAQIPISYITTDGTPVTCSYKIYLGGSVQTDQERAIGQILGATDWAGMGQEIYDYALEHPRVPQSDEIWTNDSDQTRAAISFKVAAIPLIERRLPADLVGIVGEWGSTDTCEGPFR